jgi:hypothetical protein
VLRCYERFYEIARRHSGLRFEPRTAARLEMRYWEVHRGGAEKGDIPVLARVLSELHAELFGISEVAALESAVWRARAAATVDSLTAGTSEDPEADWKRLEVALRRCYELVVRALPA